VKITDGEAKGPADGDEAGAISGELLVGLAEGDLLGVAIGASERGLEMLCQGEDDGCDEGDGTGTMDGELVIMVAAAGLVVAVTDRVDNSSAPSTRPWSPGARRRICWRVPPACCLGRGACVGRMELSCVLCQQQAECVLPCRQSSVEHHLQLFLAATNFRCAPLQERSLHRAKENFVRAEPLPDDLITADGERPNVLKHWHHRPSQSQASASCRPADAFFGVFFPSRQIRAEVSSTQKKSRSRYAGLSQVSGLQGSPNRLSTWGTWATPSRQSFPRLITWNDGCRRSRGIDSGSCWIACSIYRL